VFDLHLAAGSFDLVYDSGCFHHIAPHRRDAYVQWVATALRPGGTFALVCFTPDGGSGLTDDEVYQHRSLGGGLGYDEPRLREIWGRDFCIEALRRMREQPAGSALFGKDFLWVIRARRR
jgi:SAM-dependent methyltransferase